MPNDTFQRLLRALVLARTGQAGNAVLADEGSQRRLQELEEQARIQRALQRARDFRFRSFDLADQSAQASRETSTAQAEDQRTRDRLMAALGKRGVGMEDASLGTLEGMVARQERVGERRQQKRDDVQGVLSQLRTLQQSGFFEERNFLAEAQAVPRGKGRLGRLQALLDEALVEAGKAKSEQFERQLAAQNAASGARGASADRATVRQRLDILKAREQNLKSEQASLPSEKDIRQQMVMSLSATPEAQREAEAEIERVNVRRQEIIQELRSIGQDIQRLESQVLSGGGDEAVSSAADELSQIEELVARGGA